MSPWGWLRNVYQWREDDILKMAGTDALVFLEFVRLMTFSLATIAIPMCLVLIPTDVTYSSPDKKVAQTSSSSKNSQSSDIILRATIAYVDGPRLWIHVTLSYLATIAFLGFVYRSYQKVIRLRQDYFSSVEYQRSYFSRTLMLTDITPDIVTDGALRHTLESTNSAYTFQEVQLGLSTSNLPLLLSQQKKLVFKLERALDKALRRRLQYRPTMAPYKTWLPCASTKVDAIDYLTEELAKIEEQINAARSETVVAIPETFGFATLANVSYAHSAAHYYSKNKQQEFSVRLAPRPSDIIWSNLTKGSKARQKSRWFARFLLFGLFILNTLPLLLAAFISNFDTYLPSSASTFFSQHEIPLQLIMLILPPMISVAAALLLPQLMRKIIIYRGVRTRQSRDLHLTTQYFVFLALTQVVLFSLISVFLDLFFMIKKAVDKNRAAGEAVIDIFTGVLSETTHRFQFLSSYWITWIVLRGYLLLFELAQIQRLALLLLNRYVLPHTPRDIWSFKKPRVFSYWMVYAELLLLATVGIIYAPLAPFVTVFTAGVFMLALFVYKNQLYYVCYTKSETGGRLWSVVVKCLLTVLACMQIILALMVGLLQNWIKSIVCIPPILFVIAFMLFCHYKLEPKFHWYIPGPITAGKMKQFVRHSEYQKLERQFGNPFLHQPLSRPVVNARYMDMVREIYNGPVISSKYTAEDFISDSKRDILPVAESAPPDVKLEDDDSVFNNCTRSTSMDEALEMDSLYLSSAVGDVDQHDVLVDHQGSVHTHWENQQNEVLLEMNVLNSEDKLDATVVNDTASQSLSHEPLIPSQCSTTLENASSKISLLSDEPELDVVNDYIYEPPPDTISMRSSTSKGYRPLPLPPK